MTDFSYSNVSLTDEGYAVPQFSWDDRMILFDMAAKKDAVKLPSTGQYYYNIYESLFNKVDDDLNTELSQIPEIAPYGKYLADKAPGFVYDLSLDPNTNFNGFIANSILTRSWSDGTNTYTIQGPADLTKAVQWAYDNPDKFRLTGDSTLPYETYAKNLWVDLENVNKAYDEDYTKRENDINNFYSNKGLPHPKLRYDPRAVQGYQEWEDSKISAIKSTLDRIPPDKRALAERTYRNQLRKQASDQYASKGFSPYYDAILRARAGS